MDPNLEQHFTDFVVHRTHSLFRTAYALTGNQQAAEDLLQNALAKAALRWPTISEYAEPYVRRILYRDCVSVWRRLSRRRETSTAVLPELTVTDSAAQVDLRLALQATLLRLPPRQRAVLVLRYLDDLSDQQIAEQLNCSVGTVVSQASRGLARLRRSVDPDLLTLQEEAAR